jgi:hypothetical protein
LQRILIDEILPRVEEPIWHQSMCLGYDPEMVSHLFTNWIIDDAKSMLAPLSWQVRRVGTVGARSDRRHHVEI